MTRALVHVEGETEETFVNEILRAHLMGYEYSSVAARLLGHARARSHRGGIRSWPTVRRDIVAHLREDAGSVSTTMVDYYGLPQSGAGACPGRQGASALASDERADSVEKAMLADLREAMGSGFDARRFVPFVMMHEFEALLFSDCTGFAAAIDHQRAEPALASVRAKFETPEDIDDSPASAPSTRIRQIVPAYDKPLMGNLAILEIGLETVRRECPHFDGWLQRMEQLIATA